METSQRVAVITGASAGIGRAAARILAVNGWRIIGIGRDEGRCAAAETEIRFAAPNAEVTFIKADLAVMAEVVRVSDQIGTITQRIDLLANNAGGMASRKSVTAEGLEANFAGNHLGPFLLTERLLPLLRQTAARLPSDSVRIINTSSDGSEMIPGFDWEDLQQLGGEWSAGKAYCQSKLANVLHARGLARRLAADGIGAYSFHPGTVDSNFVAHAPEETKAHIKNLKHISPDEGADTLLWLATSDEAAPASGGYFHERRLRKPHPLFNDDAAVERLFDESRRLIVASGQSL